MILSLQWWKENKKKYPVVAALAQIFLFIPTSLAPSDQIWSRTSQVLSLKRHGICNLGSLGCQSQSASTGKISKMKLMLDKISLNKC